MINQNLDNNGKQEYQTPVLFEYGDMASITQGGGIYAIDGAANPNSTNI